MTDGRTYLRTDRQTDGRTDRILFAIPRLHYMQRGKNVVNLFEEKVHPGRGVARGVRGFAGRTILHLLGSGKLSKIVKNNLKFHMFASAIKTKYYSQRDRRLYWVFDCVRFDFPKPKTVGRQILPPHQAAKVSATPLHPGDLSGGFSDLAMTWLLYCAGSATGSAQANSAFHPSGVGK